MPQPVVSLADVLKKLRADGLAPEPPKVTLPDTYVSDDSVSMAPSPGGIWGAETDSPSAVAAGLGTPEDPNNYNGVEDQAKPISPAAAGWELEKRTAAEASAMSPDMVSGNEGGDVGRGGAGGADLSGYGGGGGGGGGKNTETTQVQIKRGIPMPKGYDEAVKKADEYGVESIKERQLATEQAGAAKIEKAKTDVMTNAIHDAMGMRIENEGGRLTDEAMAKVNNLINNRPHVDPDKFWHDRGAGAQILAVIAMALGGFASGYSGGKVPNFGMELINKAIDRDIAAQRANVDSHNAATQQEMNMYQLGLQATGSKRAANHVARADALQKTASMLESHMAQIAAGPEAKAGAAAMMRELYLQRAKELQTTAKVTGDEVMESITSKSVTGGGGGAGGTVLSKRDHQDLKYITEHVEKLGLEPFEQALDGIDDDLKNKRGKRSVNMAMNAGGAAAFAAGTVASDEDKKAYNHIADAQAQLLKLRSGTGVSVKEFDRYSAQLVNGDESQRKLAAEYFRTLAQRQRAGVYAINPNAAKAFEENMTKLQPDRGPGLGTRRPQSPSAPAKPAGPKIDFQRR